jgi:hypothetical protein
MAEPELRLPLHEHKEPDDLSQRAHRRVIGGLGLFLPILVYLFAGVRPTEGLPGWQLLGSVSAYYYTGAVGVFVGVLFALSLFLFTYQGYRGVLADRLVGTVGGTAALLVAICPTSPPAGLSPPSWWHRNTSVIHYIAAVVLFGSFIVFSLWLFRKSDIPDPRQRPREKRLRDDLCLLCGLAMIGAVAWAAISAWNDGPIFVPEAIAIEAFAISWLVKSWGGAQSPATARARP